MINTKIKVEKIPTKCVFVRFKSRTVVVTVLQKMSSNQQKDKNNLHTRSDKTLSSSHTHSDSIRINQRQKSPVNERPSPETSSSPHVPVSTSPSTSRLTDYRLLRCFCGCTQLSIDQIENFALMSVSGLVNHQLGNKLFKTFLKIGHRTDKSNALLSLECYELCNEILDNIQSYRDYFDDLIEMCPSYLWEEKFNEAVELESDTKVQRTLEELIDELKIECLDSIECHNDFDRFRKELLRKIRK